MFEKNWSPLTTPGPPCTSTQPRRGHLKLRSCRARLVCVLTYTSVWFPKGFRDRAGPVPGRDLGHKTGHPLLGVVLFV